MNYQQIYDELINRSKNRILEDSIYIEVHHIIPKCIGGTDETDNLVKLTAREHFLAHKLLCEIYPNNDNIIFSAWMMANTRKKTLNDIFKVSSREYQYLRELFVTTRTGKKHSKETINRMKKPKSNEHKEKMSKAALGRQGYWKGKSHSKTHRLKISKSRVDFKHTLETKKKISKKLKGREISKECIEKIRSKVSKPVFQLDLDGNILKKWKSAKQVFKEIGISNTDISSCCSGRLKTAGGFKWKKCVNY